MTTSTDQRDVIHDTVWDGDLLKMAARMALLAARFAAGGTAQTLDRRLGQPIRGRRPRRVPRVLRQPPLELSDLDPQLSDLPLKPLDHRGLLHNEHRELLIRRRGPVHITTFARILLLPAHLNSHREQLND
jgi:hypothetical protein